MDYPFPPSAFHPGAIRWTGRQFVSGNGDAAPAFSVLCYDQADSGWSDDLTRMHEGAAGENHPIDIASRRLALKTLRKHVANPSPVILDVGCSSGHLLKELRAVYPDAFAMGADYIPELLHRLAERMAGVPILQFDLRKCPLPDNSIDAVTCLNVLEHIDDDAAAMRQMYRILKPGGVAHVEVPAGPHLFDIYDEQLMHHRRYRLAELARLARDSGFEVLSGTHLGFILYPAFRAVKLKNRALLSSKSQEEKKAIVAGQIRSTRQSLPLIAALKVERALGAVFNFPVGIRCVVALRKR